VILYFRKPFFLYYFSLTRGRYDYSSDGYNLYYIVADSEFSVKANDYIISQPYLNVIGRFKLGFENRTRVIVTYIGYVNIRVQVAIQNLR